MKIAIYQCEGKPARTQDNLEILHQSALEAAAQMRLCQMKARRFEPQNTAKN